MKLKNLCMLQIVVLSCIGLYISPVVARNIEKKPQIMIKNVSLQTDFTGAKIKSDSLIQGCSGKDCIPSIDNPRFESARKAYWLGDDAIVFTISYKGKQRAYPQQLLNWHEIVNDKIADKYIVITFCPLCGSALAFERKVNGIITEFGVSGKLHNSDLVMYDRYEGNLWQQITGEAIVGPGARRNETLKPFPLHTSTWGEWKKAYPNTKVLSRNTGFSRQYARYPYGSYETNDAIYFPVSPTNKALHAKTIVYGIELNGHAKAYPLKYLKGKPVITDTVGDIQLKIQRLPSGELNITNLKTHKKILSYRLFWFAWVAFHPNTELYRPREM